MLSISLFRMRMGGLWIKINCFSSGYSKPSLARYAHLTQACWVALANLPGIKTFFLAITLNVLAIRLANEPRMTGWSSPPYSFSSASSSKLTVTSSGSLGACKTRYLSNGLVERNDKRHVNFVRFRQEEQATDIVILDLVVILLTTKTKENIVKLNSIATARRKERALVLVKADNDVAGRLANIGRLHDAFLQNFRGRVGLLVAWICIWIGRYVKAYRD